MKYFASQIDAEDGKLLFCHKWVPERVTRAVVCLVHGLGEHCGRYEHIAEALSREGYVVVGFDLRGHGKSSGRRGDIPSYSVMLDDIGHLVQEAQLQFPGIPLFLYGHSLGGNLVLNYVLRKTPPLTGVIVTGPWLKLAFEPPAWKIKLAKLMSRALPSITQSNGLVVSHLTHDHQVVEKYSSDPLVHDKISSRLFFNVYMAGQFALDNARGFALPLLLMNGDADKITDWQASRDFADHVTKELCTFKLWPGLYHELHNELNKEQVIDFIEDWLEENSQR